MNTVIQNLMLLLVLTGVLNGADYATKGSKFTVDLIPEKKSFMIGEPIYLRFKITNCSKEQLSIMDHGKRWNHLNRLDSFTVVTTSEKGVKVPVPEAEATGGSWASAPTIIATNGSFSYTLLLPHWAQVTKPGSYTIVAKVMLYVGKSDRRDDLPGRTRDDVPIKVQAGVKVSVVPYDEAKMGELIARLGSLMLDKEPEPPWDEDSAPAWRAAIALSTLHDDRVIRQFNRAVRQAPYDAKLIAMDALAEYKTDEALAGLRLAASDKDENIRHCAAHSLSRSAHPKAIQELLTHWQDTNSGVRLKVLHVLGTMKSAESLSRIRSMTKDKDAMVAEEAKRYLQMRLNPQAK